MTHSSSVEDRIELLNEQIDYHSPSEITVLLRLLPNPYFDISMKGYRPKLHIENYNKLLIEKLNGINYISSFKIEKGKIRVNTKRY